MKQTAVEWLVEQLKTMDTKSFNRLIQIEMSRENFEECFEQAKAMEREQIQDSFNEGFTEGCRYTTCFEQTLWEDAEQYYNETFKSK